MFCMPKKIISPPLLLAFIGKILNDVYEAGKPRFETKTELSGAINIKNSLEIASQNKDLISSYVRGGLDILRILGLITIDDKLNIQTTSRNAHFAIGSLSKFLDASVCVVDEPINDEEKKYLVNLTHLLESVRTEAKKFSLKQTP